MNSTMHVCKRGNRGYEELKFDKITQRIRLLCNDLDRLVDPVKVALETIKNIVDGIRTEQLDEISANIAESFKLIHPDYSILAGRICVSNLHKSTINRFSECMLMISETQLATYEYTNDRVEIAIDKELDLDFRPNNPNAQFDPKYLNFIKQNSHAIDNMIINERDYDFKYFGLKILMHNYLIKVDNKVCDRPQYMWMRVAIALYACTESNDTNAIRQSLEEIKICYKALSRQLFIHATPTLFNACGHNAQLLSCFLLGINDSIEGIMKCCADASIISKWSGGLGVHMTNIRGNGAPIRGTKGKSSGLIPQLMIWNALAACWDQGSKRKGAIAIYLEPYHNDILDFLRLKLPSGGTDGVNRARNLFYALWIPDLFMKRLAAKDRWSLFNGYEAKRLSEVYDGMIVSKDLATELGISIDNDGCVCANVFTMLYEKYEREHRAVAIIQASEIEKAIHLSQRESGNPYICFKDHVNRKSNQKNLGIIKSSNLCSEIEEVSSDKSYACCTLASINLPKFYDENTKIFDYEGLYNNVRLVTRNLNRVIDINKYPVDECKKNNLQMRPVGIGVQGLADVFMRMRVPFLSIAAREVDLCIFETIYFAALTESMELSKKYGSYDGFKGSPASQGILQFDMWKSNPQQHKFNMNIFSGKYNWDLLKHDIITHGIRNSLLVALMPTASTAQVLGNVESFEPITSNIYVKSTLAGTYTIINDYLIRHLMELGLYDEKMKNEILNNEGSIENITTIPIEVRKIYRTVWDIRQRKLMKRAAIRQAFIDQAQSLNIYLRDNSDKFLRGVMATGFAYGLKTCSYYIHTKAAVSALKINHSSTHTLAEAPKVILGDSCTPDCDSCSG